MCVGTRTEIRALLGCREGGGGGGGGVLVFRVMPHLPYSLMEMKNGILEIWIFQRRNVLSKWPQVDLYRI